MIRASLKIRLLATAIISVAGCAGQRVIVPPGVIPQQDILDAEDERYGHEVLNNLTEQYPLDRDDARINRVRDIVTRLTKAAGADKNPWNSYVLVGDNFKNAAATRGNYIFVWTGILKTVRNDAELATILGHEIAHVLAGHTAPDPAEETNRIIAGIAGAATGGLVGSRGLGGPASELAEIIVRASIEALLVNPDSQLKEYEADQIGLFILADAGYDPREALNFWTRIQGDPDFGNSPLEFLSSHPSTAERLRRLSGFTDLAEERYLKATGRKVLVKRDPDKRSQPRPSGLYWMVMEPKAKVFSSQTANSALLSTLPVGKEVKVVALRGRWLEIEEPVKGFIQSRYLAPSR